MSVGSTKLNFRISEELLAAIREEIQRTEDSACCVPEDLTTFIVKSIRERIAHRRRARARRHAPIPRDKDGWPCYTIGVPQDVNGD